VFPLVYIVQVSITDIDSTSRAALLREIVEGVAALAGRNRCAVARRVHHSGISLGHLQILWILQEHGPLPVSRLADWLGIGVPNATGLLDRMEQRGLVERVRDVDDRRVVHARMTELGRATVADLDGWRAELIAQVVEPLGTDQLAALARRIQQLDDEAEAAPPQRPPSDLASGRGAVPEAGVRTR
jgi:MarR family transcriptional regulator, transcriptional regulator for hemolysin